MRDARLNGADRVLAALKALGSYPMGVSLDDLTQRLKTPKSSLHRALAALRRAGLVEQDPAGRYRVGLELIRLAFLCYERWDEAQLIRPLLEAFSERFGETAHYAKLDGGEIVYLSKVVPVARGVQMTSSIGGRNPAHCTALGKALLAYTLLDDAAVEKYVADHGPLVRRTPKTLVAAEDLKREMRRVREAGYAVEIEESETGINCISLPLFIGSPTQVSAAVSISALAPRTPASVLVESVEEIRQMIRTQLGDVLPPPPRDGELTADARGHA